MGCSTRADVVSDEGSEIDCRGVPCTWTIVQGDAKIGAGWLDGDPVVDLSAMGPVVIEQRAVLIALTTRQLLLQAAVVRDDGVAIRFELDWYAAGPGFGKSFWDRSPVKLESAAFPVWEAGTSHLQRTVAVPSEAVAVVLRIAKSGSGRAVVGELTLGRFPPGRSP